MKYFQVHHREDLSALFSPENEGEVITNPADARSMINDKIKPDLLVFLGGQDLSPFLYGETICGSSAPHMPTNRDMLEMFVYKRALQFKVPMFGICRGHQFLSVMNGDSLWQHITHHPQEHHIKFRDGPSIKVPSVHHQMVKATKTSMGIVLAKSNTGATMYNEFETKHGEEEVESMYYPETNCLGVQTHPEYTTYDSEISTICRELINTNFNLSF